jgi:hypothetical protein
MTTNTEYDMKKVLYLVVFFGCLLVMPFEFALAQTGDAMVGINLGHSGLS